MARIEFNVASMIHKSLFGNACLYIKDLIEVRLSDERLGFSTSGTLLVVPRTRCLRHGDSRFCFLELKPGKVRDDLDFETFKLKLKSHFFRKYH